MLTRYRFFIGAPWPRLWTQEGFDRGETLARPPVFEFCSAQGLSVSGCVCHIEGVLIRLIRRWRYKTSWRRRDPQEPPINQRFWGEKMFHGKALTTGPNRVYCALFRGVGQYARLAPFGVIILGIRGEDVRSHTDRR